MKNICIWNPKEPVICWDVVKRLSMKHQSEVHLAHENLCCVICYSSGQIPNLDAEINNFPIEVQT